MNITGLTYGSICSGAGTCAMAFLPLGVKALWFAEIEAAPSAVLAHRFPGVPNLGDMTTLPARILAREVPSPDILMGGTPCQAFSVAGKRLSLDDLRGNLTLTFCEIAHAIDAVRAADGRPPLVILWENVPGVLSVADNAFGCFLGAMVGAGAAVPPGDGGWSHAGLVSGPRRAAAWRVVDAQYFGVAQRRRRVLVVAGAGAFRPERVLFEPEGVRRDSPPRREAGEVAPTILAGGARRRGGRSEDDVPHVCGTIQAKHGNISADAAWTGQLIPGPSPEGVREPAEQLDRAAPVAFGGNDTRGPIDVAPALNANRGCHNPGDFEAGTLCVEPVPFDTTQITSAANYSNPKAGDPCHPLARGQHPPSIAFSCKDYGADAGEVSPPLRAMGHDDSHQNGGGQVAVAGSGVAVRRLTPRECERLQGWPDDHTLVPFGKRGRPMKDGPRYKMIGNGWALPCFAWIARRIVGALA